MDNFSRPRANTTIIKSEPSCSNDAPDYKNFCRICGKSNNSLVHLFETEATNHSLVQKINQYLPIAVGRHDNLPLGVCRTCMKTVLSWHNLVQSCETTDRVLTLKLNSNLLPQYTSNNNVETDDSTRCDYPIEGLSNPSLFLILKEVFNNDYFKTLNVNEENTDLQYVCQMCPEKPASRSIECLCGHLISSHKSELCDKLAIETFIKEYFTFEEVLTNDSVSDDESEKQIDIPNYFCPCCESVFSSPTRLICHLNKHVEVNIDDGVLCCDNLYADKKSFVSHLQDKHVNKTTDGALVCKTCGSVEDNVEALEVHINENHSSIEEQRKKIEPNPKCQKFIPAVCPECNKTFSNKYNMLTHMKSHSEVINSKFICCKCNKSYKNRGSLTYHQKVFHEGLLRFLCSLCGEAFPSRVARDTHERIHTGFRPFCCKYCNKSFRAQNTLDRHIDMHLNIRNYECDTCPKKFRKRTHLDYHLKTHAKK